MVDRLARAWRLVRRVPALGGVAGSGQADPASFAPPPRRRPSRSAGTRRDCSASGWQVRSGCGDGAGGTICPLCSQRVRTSPHSTVTRGIEVIQAHTA